MQIDFHLAGTYVIARMAGFDHEQARIIGSCAQYVDDAAENGAVRFHGGYLYAMYSSAHKMLDYRNFEELANHRMWIPFHFLPGNNSKELGDGNEDAHIDRLLCRPDSAPAREMLRSVILQGNAPYGLHRLGVAMHVYADTWAHQGFAGVIHEVNSASNIRQMGSQEADPDMTARVSNFFGDLFDRAGNALMSSAMPLGHGAVLSFPDRPYLRWQYENGRGETVLRDNPTDFMTAADRMCIAMKRFLQGDPDAQVSGLTDEQSAKLYEMIINTTDESGDDRLEKWKERIRNGDFGFAPAELEYDEDAWKPRALGEAEDGKYHYRPEDFLTSDWKLFHDAARAHAYSVLYEILPMFGIVAA